MTDKDSEKAKAEAEKARSTNVKETLGSTLMQNVFAGNYIKSNAAMYGIHGVNGGEAAYFNAMNSEEAQKARQEMYMEKVQKGNALGVFGEAPAPTNYDVSMKMMAQMDEVMNIATVGELEKHAVENGAKLSEISDKYKGMSLAGMAGKDGKVDTESNAYKVFSGVKEAYRLSLINKAISEGSYAKINSSLEEIAEAEKPKDDKKSE